MKQAHIYTVAEAMRWPLSGVSLDNALIDLAMVDLDLNNNPPYTDVDISVDCDGAFFTVTFDYVLSDEEYTRREGDNCPECSSYNIDTAGKPDVAGGGVSLQVKCNDCGSTWVEMYNLVGYGCLETPGKEQSL